MPAQWYSVPLMPQQAPVNPHPCQRLLDTHMQVCLRLLWGHCCFLLGPDVHEVSFVLSKSLFPLFYGSSVIKFHWPPKSNSLGFLSPFAGLLDWEICCGSQNFCSSAELLWYKFSPIYGMSAWLLHGGGNATSSKRCYATCYASQVCFSQSPCPCNRLLLTYACTGDTQTLRSRSGSVSVEPLGPGAHKVLLEPSKHHWQTQGLILNAISSLLSSCWDFSFALGHRVSLFMGSNILLSMVVQQGDEILESLQEKMSKHPFTLPSQLNHITLLFIKFFFAQKKKIHKQQIYYGFGM